MSMTESAANIALCNQSLGLLGAAEITLSGSSTNHTYCTTFFDDSRDEILISHPWNFARKRAYAVETTDPIFGYDHAFTKPSDCLRVLKVADVPTADYRVEGGLILTDDGTKALTWVTATKYIAGQYITSDDSGSDLTYLVDTTFTSGTETSDLATYCSFLSGDYEVLEVEYIYQVTDVSSYPAFLRQCVVYNLAIKLCSPIKQDEKVALNLQTMLLGGKKTHGILQAAKSFDAQESGGTVINEGTSTFLDARR